MKRCRFLAAKRFRPSCCARRKIPLGDRPTLLKRNNYWFASIALKTKKPRLEVRGEKLGEERELPLDIGVKLIVWRILYCNLRLSFHWPNSC
ncbi:hypothetical protein O9929_23240 [Vibrio lentus]|nr:hypothetical protein [Vibrio lentus]